MGPGDIGVFIALIGLLASIGGRSSPNGFFSHHSSDSRRIATK